MIPRVQAVVDLITGERERFERFCRSLSEEELRRPVPDSSWIVKDFISHLATIDPPIARWFAAVAAGHREPLGGAGEPWDVDQYNDAAVVERREHSVDALLAEAAEERAALIRVMDRLTEMQLEQRLRFSGDRKRPPADILLGRYLQGWARHDVIHVADMLKALFERRSDPMVAAWLGEPAVAAVVGSYTQAMR